jgi:hypothetical protein
MSSYKNSFILHLKLENLKKYLSVPINFKQIKQLSLFFNHNILSSWDIFQTIFFTWSTRY